MKAHTKEWTGKSFGFRSPSEHRFNTGTVADKQMELEMQVIFDSVPFDVGYEFKHAGISIMFSVNDHNVKLSNAE